MGLRLVDDDLDLSIELVLEPQIRQALVVQLQRVAAGLMPAFEVRFIKQLYELIDADLQPPTSQQITYALAIAKSLEVSLPGEALRFKGSMSDFLNRYAPLFR